MKGFLISLAAILGISSATSNIEPFELKDEDCIRYESVEKESTNQEIKESKSQLSVEKKSTELNKTKIEWSFLPTPPKEIENYKEKYNAFYEGNNKNKEIYLTFDCGYENGVTNKILDVLKKNNVKAAFFVTGHYLDTAPSVVKRMSNEGHIVGNHTDNHPSLPEISKNGISKVTEEIESVSKQYKKITGKDMDKYVRPPMGEFSETSLYYTNSLGYKSIFWNCAYKDYDVKNQPSKSEAKKTINQRVNDGGIILLHAISKTNAEILDDLIKDWKSKGYEFKTLDELKY